MSGKRRVSVGYKRENLCYDDAMKPLRIWIPDALYDALSEGARREHHSLAQQVVHLLTAATPVPSNDDRGLLETRVAVKEQADLMEPVSAQ